MERQKWCVASLLASALHRCKLLFSCANECVCDFVCPAPSLSACVCERVCRCKCVMHAERKWRWKRYACKSKIIMPLRLCVTRGLISNTTRNASDACRYSKTIKFGRKWGGSYVFFSGQGRHRPLSATCFLLRFSETKRHSIPLAAVWGRAVCIEGGSSTS